MSAAGPAPESRLAPYTKAEVEALANRVEMLTFEEVCRLFATIRDLQAQVGPYATLRRGHEREDLEAAGIEAVTCSKDFLLAITNERDELRQLVMPKDRPTTVRDYLAPILAFLDGHAGVEEDGRSENDHAQTLCWIRDAIAHDHAEALRASGEIVQTGAAKAADSILTLKARNDALLDQLSALLPENVDRYLASLQWTGDAGFDRKTLVDGNIRAFASAVRSRAPIPTEEEAGRNP